MRLNAILFDLDGTLWEVVEETYMTAKEVTEKYQLPEVTKDMVIHCMGMSSEECAKNYFPTLEVDMALQKLYEVNDLNVKRLKVYGGHVYEGLEETLKKLKPNYKLGIVSNCGKGYIESFLESSHLEEYFDYIKAAGYLKISKAEAIELVVKENNLQAIYVGDTIKDLEASRDANIPFIHARYGFGDDLGQKYQIYSIKELPQLLETIN